MNARTRTTVEIPTSLLRRAKIQAVREGTDLRLLIIEGLEMRLRAAATGKAGMKAVIKSLQEGR